MQTREATALASAEQAKREAMEKALNKEKAEHADLQRQAVSQVPTKAAERTEPRTRVHAR